MTDRPRKLDPESGAVAVAQWKRKPQEGNGDPRIFQGEEATQLKRPLVLRV